MDEKDTISRWHTGIVNTVEGDETKSAFLSHEIYSTAKYTIFSFLKFASYELSQGCIVSFSLLFSPSHSPTHSFSQSDHSHTWSSEVISAIKIPLGEILILLEEIYPVVKTEPMPINKVNIFNLILIICFVNCFCY